MLSLKVNSEKNFFICGLPNFHRALFDATVAFLDAIQKQIKFVIIANSVAVKQIEKENIKGLDWIELNSKASDFYESKSSFCQAQCMIISTRGTEMESAAIKFADKYNIPKAKIVDTWYGYNRRMFTELDEKLGSSKLLVIDERAKSEAIKSGIADSMVEIVGQPAWQTQKST